MSTNDKIIMEQILQLMSSLSVMQKEEPEEPNVTSSTKSKKVEMLTIKECAAFAPGLSEHTIRQLVLQGKIYGIRTGQGKNGKILISKEALSRYLTGDDRT
ncbi:hypothetical protein SAMN02910317_00791 [Ruminococcaceae bacterium FB2012]|nr:hypothetical protein SAMN02910317_00791 [Ruminococcaceae bacterium FB2012]